MTAENICNATNAKRIEEVANLIAPKIRELAPETERCRRVSAEVIDELREAGIFRVLQPKAFGGLELGWPTMMSITTTLAAACGSTGWVAGLAMAHQWLIANFPIEAQQDVWANNPGAIAFGGYRPSGTATPAKSGYRISGTWRFASGCDNADWALLGATLPPASSDQQKPRVAFVLIPKGDFLIEDDWHAMGLCGTGSKTIVCDDAPLPAHRTLSLPAVTTGRTPGGDHHGVPLYRMPLLSCLPMSITMPPLGMLEGALKEFQEGTGERQTRGAIIMSGKSVADHETVQSSFAEAWVSLDSAKLLVARDISDVERFAEQGSEVPESIRIRNRLSQAYAVKQAVTAIAAMLDCGGGAGVYSDNHVQRVWRDINAAARHIAFSWGAVSTMFGQHILGRPITSSVGY